MDDSEAGKECWGPPDFVDDLCDQVSEMVLGLGSMQLLSFYSRQE